MELRIKELGINRYTVEEKKFLFWISFCDTNGYCSLCNDIGMHDYCRDNAGRMFFKDKNKCQVYIDFVINCSNIK